MLVLEKNKIIEGIQQSLSAHKQKNAFVEDSQITKALRVLETNAIPNNKHEEYKYCNLEGIFRRDFKTLDNSFSDAYTLPDFLKNKSALILVNGKLINSNNIPAYIKVEQKSEGDFKTPEFDAMLALNTAYCSSLITLSVQENKIIENVIYIVHIASGKGNLLTNPRLNIVLNKNSKAEICEVFLNQCETGNYFENRLTNVTVLENAECFHYRIANPGFKHYNHNHEIVKVLTNAKYHSYVIAFHNKMYRHNLNVFLEESNSETHLFGLSLSKKDGIIDHHTSIAHTKPNCFSNELYKGIADDRSSLIFNGKILVYKDAQKTNAYQSSKNIQLSEDASVYSKPQLEILANDVKCSHGTSTGKINEEALFYLKARGIGERSANKLLLGAFTEDVIEKLNNEELKNWVRDLLNEEINE
jgi:Fe-S cluster assembly protein SufD